MVALYNPDELARMPRRHKQLPANEAGELTARVFELLDEGKSVREIVIQTRETMPKIDEIREQWLDAGGCDLVIGKNAKAELERYIGTFRTVGELVQRYASALGMPIAGTPIAEVIARGQEERETIEAIVPDDVSDERVERAIAQALDAIDASAP